MDNYSKLLKLIRPFTGDAFTAKQGYDARKPLNFGQRMAVLRYAEKVNELLNKEHVLYKPKRGEKTAAFEYTGQTGFRKFDTAIIEKWNRDADLRPVYDHSRPAGSRFYMVDVRSGSGQAYYNIPSHLLYNQSPEVIKAILEFYGPDCELYIIQAGESYIWGAAGSPGAVAERINDIFENYGAKFFDADNRNSSYYGNWFRGVTAFTHRRDAYARIADAKRRQREYLEAHHVHPDMRDEKVRQLKDGSLGVWKNGRFMGRVQLSPEIIRQLRKTRNKPKPST